MASPALKAATAAQQRLFGPYLGTRPEVQHAAHGRGVLVGLPNCHINDGKPLGSVEFASLPDGHFPDYRELSELKLVLYDGSDALEVASHAALPKEVALKALTVLLRAPRPIAELQLWAEVVDAARALGIALNLPAGSYVRKEVSRG